MSKPLFEDAFGMGVRRNRGSFALLCLVLLLGVIVVFFPIAFAFSLILASIVQATQNIIIVIAIVILISLALLALSLWLFLLIICAGFQRCNDIGISRLWALGFIASGAWIGQSPVFREEGLVQVLLSRPDLALTSGLVYIAAHIGFFLFLMIKPGQKGANAFGPSPLNRASAGTKKAGKSSAKRAKKKAGRKS